MPVITTNTSANSALRYLNINSDNQTQALNRIASGSKITSAADDAAGLAVSMKLQNDVAVLNQAQTNASHATAMLETADGALSEIADILERMKVLATSSLSGAVESERANIDAEYQKLIDELGDIASNTEFNGTTLLDGTFAAASIDGTVSGGSSITYTGASVDDFATGDSLSFVYDSKTVTVTLSNGTSNLQADVDAAMKSAGFESGLITATLSGTGVVTLTENAITDDGTGTATLLDVTSGNYTEVEGGASTVTAAAGTTAVPGTAQSEIAFAGLGATGDDSAALSTGDTISFSLNGKQITATLTNGTTNLQADIDAALVAADLDPTVYTVTADVAGDDLTLTAAAADANGDPINLSAGEVLDKDATSNNSSAKTLDFMVGVSSSDVISVSLADMSTSTLGVSASAGTGSIASTSVDTVDNATAALDVLDEAVSQVANARAELGAQMSRFEYRSDSLSTTEENLDAAQSAITDADVAEEQANLSSAQVLTNAAIAALSAANEMPQELERLFN